MSPVSQKLQVAPEVLDPPTDDPSRDRIASNFAAFDAEVSQAEQLLARGELDAAAVSVAMAAHIATSAHCGVFWSLRLERVLNAIGGKLPDPAAGPLPASSLRCYRHILHVCTQVHDTGGVARMLSRWTTSDHGRVYSLALTQHRGPIPGHVREAIQRSGGEIHHLNHQWGGQLRWAQSLRELARRHDAIVLHTHCEDVIPPIAFARPECFPPVLLLNHADHLFWLGTSIAHAVISLRDAASDLAVERRGVDPARSLLMPTIVNPTVRQRTRNEAKRALGLDSAHTLILSVARAPKYRTINGLTYADRHLPLLLEHRQAELIVVGVGEPEDWRPAIAASGGRIRPLRNQDDPRPYFEAADIYVDSYPFVSSTSMMEAAGYGLPLVTIFKSPDAARIVGINHFGLVGTALVARTDEAYLAQISHLIRDEAARREAGEAARNAIVKMHAPPGWLDFLEAAYARASDLPPLDASRLLAGHDPEQPHFGEPDCRHQDMFQSAYPMSGHLKAYMGMVPWQQQLAYWRTLRKSGAFGSAGEAASFLMPEWLKRSVKDRHH